MAGPAITSSSPPPATACTPSTTASCCSPSPNLFSATAKPHMTTICQAYEANSPPRGCHRERLHDRQRRSRRPHRFDEPVIHRPLGWLLVRLGDRFGLG